MERVFLGDEELGELQALHSYAQAKAQEARLAQLGVEAYIRWLAARHGLGLQGHYGVSPRGELLALPPEGQGSGVKGQGFSEPLALDPVPSEGAP